MQGQNPPEKLKQVFTNKQGVTRYLVIWLPVIMILGQTQVKTFFAPCFNVDKSSFGGEFDCLQLQTTADKWDVTCYLVIWLS